VKNYKTGEYFDWGLNSIKDGKKTNQISQEEFTQKQTEAKKAKDEIEKQKAVEEKVAAEKAKKYFEGFFKASSVNTSQNKYLQRKGINQKIIEGIKFTKDDKLVVPVHDNKGAIQSLQFIDADGKKTFLTGGKKMGNFFMINAAKVKNSKEIYLAEGFATGVSIHMATNKPVAITFDAGNIEHVLKNLKELIQTKNLQLLLTTTCGKKKTSAKKKQNLLLKNMEQKLSCQTSHSLTKMSCQLTSMTCTNYQEFMRYNDKLNLTKLFTNIIMIYKYETTTFKIFS